ncbi:hypothetical protein WAI453_002520 [Rhynchosporium graminicola]
MATNNNIPRTLDSPTPSSLAHSSSSFTRLVRRSDVPRIFQGLRDRLLYPDIKRNEHSSRYKTGGIVGVTRDVPPNLTTWSRESDDPYECTDPNGNLPQALQQPFMLYYEAPKDRVYHENQLCLYQLIWDDKEPGLYIERPQGNVRVPTGIRPGDCLIGAAYCDTSTGSLFEWFPADFSPIDGHPYSQRVAFGDAFRPRLAMNDFPLNGLMTPDMRIGYIVCPNGDIVVLGGQKFDAANITKEMWCNWHHYFVEIITRGCLRDKLRPVLQEPQELKRQKKIRQKRLKEAGAVEPTKEYEEDIQADRKAFQPIGASSVFDSLYQTLSPLIEAKEDVGIIARRRTDRQFILDNAPTRGHDSSKPSFEIFPQAMASAAMYHGAYISLAAETERTHKSIGDFLYILDRSLLDRDRANYAPHLLQTLCNGRSLMIQAHADTKAVVEECFRALQDVPNPIAILDALPTTLISTSHRSAIALLSEVMCTIAPETVGPVQILRPLVPDAVASIAALPRINVDGPGYHTEFVPGLPYQAPFHDSDLTMATSGILFHVLRHPPTLLTPKPRQVPVVSDETGDLTFLRERLNARGPIFQSEIKSGAVAYQQSYLIEPRVDTGNATNLITSSSDYDIQSKLPLTPVNDVEGHVGTVDHNRSKDTKGGRKSKRTNETDVTKPNGNTPKRYKSFVFAPLQLPMHQPSRPGHHWRVTDPVKNRMPFLRKLMSIWGLTRVAGNAEMTHAIEDLVNQENWGNTTNGRLFGTIVPDTEPQLYEPRKPYPKKKPTGLVLPTAWTSDLTEDSDKDTIILPKPTKSTLKGKGKRVIRPMKKLAPTKTVVTKENRDTEDMTSIPQIMTGSNFNEDVLDSSGESSRED